MKHKIHPEGVRTFKIVSYFCQGPVLLTVFLLNVSHFGPIDSPDYFKRVLPLTVQEEEKERKWPSVFRVLGLRKQVILTGFSQQPLREVLFIRYKWPRPGMERQRMQHTGNHWGKIRQKIVSLHYYPLLATLPQMSLHNFCLVTCSNDWFLYPSTGTFFFEVEYCYHVDTDRPEKPQ